MKNKIFRGTHFYGLPLSSEQESDYFLSDLQYIFTGLNHYINSRSKTLFVRANLTLPIPLQEKHKEVFQHFLDSLDFKLKYKNLDPLIFACRERCPTNDNIHFHIALLLNGSKIEFINKVMIMLQILWSHSLKEHYLRGHVNFNTNSKKLTNGIMITNTKDQSSLSRFDLPNRLSQVTSMISYLAKTHSRMKMSGSSGFFKLNFPKHESLNYD